jgi:predicted dehydrogenase
MNQSIHSIDLLQWLMGRVERLRAYTDTLAHRMETEDTAVAVLRFANGALGTIGATTAAYPGVTTRVEVCGDRGSAVIERDRLAYLHLAQEEEEVGPYGLDDIQPPAEAAPAAFGTSHTLQIEDMVRAIREDGTPMVDGRAGRHPVEIILGIYESARSGEEVTL